MDFIDKYCPKKLTDLVGNVKQIEIIYEWLKNFNENGKKILSNNNRKKKVYGNKQQNILECSSIIITGHHGIGKTLSINLITKALGYTIIKLKNVFVSNFDMTSQNVINLMNNNNKLEVKLIDEIESINSIQDRAIILELIKKNDEIWSMPIIFISDSQHNKLLSDIKKISYEIKFYKPCEYQLKQLISRISKEEKIKFQNMKVVDDIIEYTQFDIRRLLYTLQELTYSYNKQLITSDILTNYINSYKKKDIDFNLFDSAEKLLYDFKSIENSINYFDIETVLLPLMMHQYYTQVIIQNNNINDKTKNDKDFEVANEIADSISKGDVIENLIYGDQNWRVRDIHGFYTCVYTSYKLTNFIKENKNEISKCNLEFPKDLNKTSIKKINKKNIDNASKCLINKDISDFIYICKIVKQLIKNNKLEECSRLLKPHGVKIEHIESLLKIEKIQYKTNDDKSTKITLTSKQKKELQNYLN